MARYATSDGVRHIEGEDGYSWGPGDAGVWIRDDGGQGPVYVLEKRRRNPKDGTADTGWYLYDDQPGGFFGECCGPRILDAVDEANRLIDKADRGREPTRPA